MTSQAPTGTVSSFLNLLDTGIEPFFDFSIKRRVRDHQDKWKEFTLCSKELASLFPPEQAKEKAEMYELLRYETANMLPFKNHLNILKAGTDLIHTGISKTLNMKKGTTVEEIISVLNTACTQGLKGLTIYRDGSLENVITSSKETPKTQEVVEVKQEIVEVKTKIDDIPDERKSYTFTAKGLNFTAHLTLTTDKNNQIREVFIQAGDIGADINSLFAGLGMSISVALRNHPDVVDAYIKTLQKVKMDDRIVCSLENGTKIIGSSLPNIIGQLLAYLKKQLKTKDIEVIESKTETVVTRQADICPSCHQISLTRSGSCFKCSTCGYSSC
jgi:ribonucleoside-diphosphate reductase alpha chain